MEPPNAGVDASVLRYLAARGCRVDDVASSLGVAPGWSESGVSPATLVTALSSALATAPAVPAGWPAFLAGITAKGYFQGLPEGGAEYNSKLEAARARFDARAASSSAPAAAPTPAPAPAPVDSASTLAAEAAKARGNDAFKAGRWEAAIEAYTEAIELGPTAPSAHIYYANRSAARGSAGDWAGACDDARASLALDGKFMRAHQRHGTALSKLGRHDDARAAFEYARTIDPGNEGIREAAKAAEAAAKRDAAAVDKEEAAPTGGGVPDLSGLAGLLGGAGGGAGGLAGLMNNPMLASMMSNPAMMSMAAKMMQDPQAMSQMMGALGGGAGGLGGLAGLMGGLGGMGGGGGGGGPALPP